MRYTNLRWDPVDILFRTANYVTVCPRLRQICTCRISRTSNRLGFDHYVRQQPSSLFGHYNHARYHPQRLWYHREEIQGPQSSPCSPSHVSLRACAASILTPRVLLTVLIPLRAVHLLPAFAWPPVLTENSSQRLSKLSDRLISRPTCSKQSKMWGKS